jgi:hypothetical protein
MSAEKRIEYLMGAALRADQEGDGRTARSLRRMADEARELEARKLERRMERPRPRVDPGPVALAGGAE